MSDIFRRLGNRPDKIARVLEQHKCFGTPGSGICPLEKWAKQQPGVAEVTIGYSVATIHYFDFERSEVIDLSQPLQEFIRRFDHHRYPYLET